MVNGPLINGSAKGAAIGTVIMPGVGTVVGGVAGGLVSMFGGPDAQQHQSSIGGQTIDARQIYEQIKGGPGTGSLEISSQAANALKGTHETRAQQIAALNKQMDAAWQGDSSTAAQAGGHPLEIWLKDSSDNLGDSHKFIDNQISDFHTVASKVQSLPSNPPSMGFVDHINPFSDKDDEINAYNKKGQANVDAFNAYYQASAQNAAGMPQYKAWTGNNIADGNPGDGGNGSGSGGGGGGGGFGGGGGSGSGAGNLPGYGGKPPSTHLPGTGGGGHDTPIHQPNPPISSLPGYQGPNFNDGTTAAGFTPPGTSADSDAFGPGAFGPGGGGAGGGGAGGAFGAGGAGAYGAGGAGALAAGASTGAGASAGAGAGGSGAGAAGLRGGAAGAAGRAGMTGMGGMGHGGKGKGADDEEHETKYLVSEDPNELFGTDELTAPPVIGE
jgi:uncharacterized membrane protein YgcG